MSEPEQLSTAGEARRAEILERVLAASGSRRRRRAVGRSMVVVAPIVVVAVVWAMLRQPGVPAPNRQEVVVLPRQEESVSAVRMVATDPGIVTRWSAPTAPTVALLRDDELFSLLAAEGRATGMVRTGATVRFEGFTPDEGVGPAGRAPETEPIIYAGMTPARAPAAAGV